MIKSLFDLLKYIIGFSDYIDTIILLLVYYLGNYSIILWGSLIDIKQRRSNRSCTLGRSSLLVAVRGSAIPQNVVTRAFKPCTVVTLEAPSSNSSAVRVVPARWITAIPEVRVKV